MGLFDELDATEKGRDVILRAPFGYPGGKSRSIKEILPHLPYRMSYVEPFGGSAAVLLSRKPSDVEVYNDRYGGVVSFYRCIREKKNVEALIDRLEWTVHSREEFVWCKKTWKNVDDDVERAARWYYMVQTSFGSLARNFGRATKQRGTMGIKLKNKLPLLYDIHRRLKNVQVENQDWEQCFRDYDTPDTVFYLDPPYVDASEGTYQFELSKDAHRKLINMALNAQGFVAISGYANPMYDNQDWDERYEWDSFVSIQSLSCATGNKKESMRGQEKRGHAREVLWIKR